MSSLFVSVSPRPRVTELNTCFSQNRCSDIHHTANRRGRRKPRNDRVRARPQGCRGRSVRAPYFHSPSRSTGIATHTVTVATFVTHRYTALLFATNLQPKRQRGVYSCPTKAGTALSPRIDFSFVRAHTRQPNADIVEYLPALLNGLSFRFRSFLFFFYGYIYPDSRTHPHPMYNCIIRNFGG